MTRRPSLAILLVVMVVCFMFGILTVLASQPGRLASASPTPTPTFISPQRPDQQTILILGVDGLAETAPKLEAVWIATYRLPAKDLFLLGVPTNLKPDEDAPSRLSDLFAFSAERGVDPAFIQELQLIVPLPMNAVVVLDEQAFGVTIDYLGGIQVNGAEMNGAQVISVVGLLRENPSALLTAQQHFVEAMTARVSSLDSHPDLSPLLELLPEHAFISVDVKALVDEVAPLLPLRPEAIHIDLPWAQASPQPQSP
ncbi:MAG: hypothetical protein A2Z37_07520 [Chloroflexi bacterium RBG_19FT_COMBO_62_14]|nr:MAG: hypothetical protein A2Z37_07520 [Chloroflexi bacterium RBG_19FT_COMBO_62_14]